MKTNTNTTFGSHNKTATAKKQTAKLNKAEHSNGYQELLDRIADSIADDDLYLLARITANSVLKLLSTKTNVYDPKLNELKADGYKSYTAITQLIEACNNADEMYYKRNGDRKHRIIDKQENERLTKLLEYSCGDGLDLVHEAMVKLLEELQQYGSRLDVPHERKRLSRTVYTTNDLDISELYGDSETVGDMIKPEIEMKTATGVQMAHRAVRNYIKAQKTIKADQAQYSFDSIDNMTDDFGEIAFFCFEKYADIGGYSIDFNGRPYLYTADTYSTLDHIADELYLDEIIAEMGLTSRQSTILHYRRQGFSNHAIAKKLHIRRETVIDHLRAIQRKALKIGFAPDNLL